MLESCQNAQERWGGVHQMIDRWLHERCQLISAYQALQNNQYAPASSVADFKSFCEILVDYLSGWHFEIYEQLLEEAKAFHDRRGLALVKQINPRLEAITAAALTFNDHFDSGDYDATALSDELQRLSELLPERFELEDCLIEVLHNAHKMQAARVI